MPRADSILHDARWPALAARISSTSARQLPLAQLATEHGIVLRRLQRAVRVAGLQRAEEPPLAVMVSIHPSQLAALERVCARHGWRVSTPTPTGDST